MSVHTIYQIISLAFMYFMLGFLAVGGPYYYVSLMTAKSNWAKAKTPENAKTLVRIRKRGRIFFLWPIVLPIALFGALKIIAQEVPYMVAASREDKRLLKELSKK